jgi:hypothetical protein
MPCKNTIKGQYETNMFFKKVYMHFVIPRSIISDSDTRFISAFWTTLWENMDTVLKKYTTFHSQIDGKIETMNVIFVNLSRGYN